MAEYRAHAAELDQLGVQVAALSVDEPGAYGIILLRDAGVLVHTEDFEIAAATVLGQDKAELADSRM